MVSRPKPPAQQEEEMGNEIKLGDFEDVHALSVSEARAVVTAVHEARKKKDPENNPLRDRIYNDNQYVDIPEKEVVLVWRTDIHQGP